MLSQSPWAPIRRQIDSIKYGRRYRSGRFAENYHTGKTFEGYQGHLLSTLQSLIAISGCVAVDIGTGTGQIAERIAAESKRVYGFDRSASMIEFAASRITSNHNVEFAIADARQLPLEKKTADVVIYGWSLLGMLVPSWEEDWRAELRSLLEEAHRVLRDGGSIAVFETMSIGNELPAGNVWHRKRRELMDVLRSTHGFARHEFSNDWDFRSLRNLRFYAPIWFDRRSVRMTARTGSNIIQENAAMLWRKY